MPRETLTKPSALLSYWHHRTCHVWAISVSPMSCVTNNWCGILTLKKRKCWFSVYVVLWIMLWYFFPCVLLKGCQVCLHMFSSPPKKGNHQHQNQQIKKVFSCKFNKQKHERVKQKETTTTTCQLHAQLSEMGYVKAMNSTGRHWHESDTWTAPVYSGIVSFVYKQKHMPSESFEDAIIRKIKGPLRQFSFVLL